MEYLYPLYNWFFWNLCFFVSLTGYSHSHPHGKLIGDFHENKRLRMLFFLFFMFSIFTFFGGDDLRMKDFVLAGYDELYPSMEHVYVLLARMVTPHYLLWKFCIIVPSLILYYYSLKLLGINSYISYIAFTFFILTAFGASRGVLSCGVFIFAASLLDSRKRFGRLFAYFLACATVLFHNSMIVPVAFLLFSSIVSLSRRKIILLVLLVPFIVQGIDLLFESIFNYDFLIDSYAGRKLTGYTNEETHSDDMGQHSIVSNAIFYVDTFLTVIMLIYSLKAYLKGVLSRGMQKIVIVSLFLFVFGMVLMLSNIYNSIQLAGRYVGMIPGLLFIVVHPIEKHRIVNKRIRNAVFTICFLKTNIMFLYFVYDYYLNGRVIT